MNPAPHQDGLPALPEPYRTVDIYLSHPVLRTVLFVPGDYFTADHMRAYAHAAVADFLERSGQYLTNDATREAARPLLVQGEAVHQFRKKLCSDWYDGHPDPSDGGGPYECRTLYAHPLPVQGEAVRLLTRAREIIGADWEDGQGEPLRQWADDVDALVADNPKAQPAPEPAQQAVGSFVVSVVMTKIIPTGINTQNKLYAVEANSPAEAEGIVLRQAIAEFPEHSFHTVCHMAAAGRADAQPADKLDAMRYRWLRDDTQSDWAICEWSADNSDGIGYYRDARAASVVDAAIDAEMLAASGKPKPEICGNCETELPGGCGGLFLSEGSACKFAARAEKGGT